MVRPTEAEMQVFEAARLVLHSRGATCSLPSRADTLSMLAAAVCHAAARRGYLRWQVHCRAAPEAWEREHAPGYLQNLVGPWVRPPG
jgi:hypothetical protein